MPCSRPRPSTLRWLLLAGAALALPSAHASLVTNGGFETGTIHWNGAWGAYCYSSATCAATGWSGDYLLTSTGSWAWGFPGSLAGFDAATQGVVVAGLQNAESIQQTVHIVSDGQYNLDWRDAGRPSSGFTYYDHDYELLIDGALLGTYHTNAGQAWSGHAQVLNLSAGDHVLKFLGKAHIDATTFLDSVSLVGADAGAANPGGASVPEPRTLGLALGALALLAWTSRGQPRRRGATFADAAAS